MLNEGHILHELPDYLTGRLDEQSRRKLEDHLKLCSRCQSELDEIRIAIEMVRDHKAWEPPAEYWTSLLPRVKRRIQEASASQGVVSRSAVSIWIERLAPAAALAVGILLVIRTVAFESGKVADQAYGEEFRTLVQMLEVAELAELVEPVVAPPSVVPSVQEVDESGLLSELLAEDYSAFEPLYLFDVSTGLESLTDDDVEEVLMRLNERNSR